MTSIALSSHLGSGFVNTSKYELLKPTDQEITAPPTQSRPESSTVTISGRAMLLSRLFRTDDLDNTPKIEASTTQANTSGSAYNFLTANDRETLSRLYEVANAEAVDLVEVDHIAFDLAHYRMAGPGGPLDATGFLFDSDGQPIISEFNASDEAVAQRVLTSKAIGDSLFDKGFLASVFNPAKTPVHASDFSFLERAIYAFSIVGFDGATDPEVAPVIRPKKGDFPPLKLVPEAVQEGNETMLSRLAGSVLANASISSASQFLDFLNESDKDFLGRLYGAFQSRNEDFLKIDHLAITMGHYRMMSG